MSQFFCPLFPLLVFLFRFSSLSGPTFSIPYYFLLIRIFLSKWFLIYSNFPFRGLSDIFQIFFHVFSGLNRFSFPCIFWPITIFPFHGFSSLFQFFLSVDFLGYSKFFPYVFWFSSNFSFPCVFGPIPIFLSWIFWRIPYFFSCVF